jgi:hypothetical protein
MQTKSTTGLDMASILGVDHEQQGLAESVEQTPVAGSTSSTFRAASRSPARYATIDLTCS